MTSRTTTATMPAVARGIPALRPVRWLQRGWSDMARHPGPSLAYGIIVTAIGLLILSFGNHPYFVAAAATGFLLIGPILSTGPCELSRRAGTGEAAGFEASLTPLTRDREGLTRFAAFLLAVGAIWFGVSTLLLSWTFGDAVPATTTVMWGDALASATAAQWLFYLSAGGALAVLVFALSVVAVPLLIERADTDAGDAMRASLTACGRNLPAAVVWALLIAALVTIGFATLLLALVVIFPLLGHATWHAYQDLTD